MVFVLSSVDTVYHISSFVHVEPSLHAWDQLKLIRVYVLFDVKREMLF